LKEHAQENNTRKLTTKKTMEDNGGYLACLKLNLLCKLNIANYIVAVKKTKIENLHKISFFAIQTKFIIIYLISIFKKLFTKRQQLKIHV